MSVVEDKGLVWKRLSSVNVTRYVKVLQNSKYITWSDALKLAKDEFPGLTWGVIQADDGLPYYASKLGIWVKVWVRIEEDYQELFMPVLNSAHKTLKEERYSYFVKEYVWDNMKKKNLPTGKMIEKWVEGATSFDVNTATMRGLVKCLALLGLGINIYQDAPAPPPRTIGSAELQTIMDLIKEKGIPLDSVVSTWNLQKIAHLHEESFIAMIEYLNQV